VNDPANAVAIPGLNEFMPLAVGGDVVLATAVHEGAHAVACRREGIPVEEWGVALLGWVLPVAAYVLPGDELDAAPPRSRIRVFAAGVLVNLVLGAIALAGLFAPPTAGPVEAYLTYFGWVLVGGSPPTAASVGALGPATNLLFWTALLSGNLAAMNALPVGVLDGGRVLGTVLRHAAPSLERSPDSAVAAVRVVGGVTLALVAVTLLAPHVTP